MDDVVVMAYNSLINGVEVRRLSMDLTHIEHVNITLTMPTDLSEDDAALIAAFVMQWPVFVNEAFTG